MTTYHCQNSEVIERVEVHSPHHDSNVASITAHDCATGEQLEQLRAALGKKGYSTLMNVKDDKTAVEVRGIDNIPKFITQLKATGMAGHALVKDESTVEHQKIGFGDKLRSKSFFLSAIFYDIGNLALIISGIQKGRHNPNGKMTRHDKSELGIGASFAVGDILMTIYDAKGNEELLAANQALTEHLRQKGIEVPSVDTLNPDMLHQTGAVKATDRWLRKNIVHIKCAAEVIGGLFTIHSALKPDARNDGKLAAGFLITTGWLSTFLLERPRGSEVFKDTNSTIMPDSIEKMVPDAILENPRGWVARPAAMSNNVANLWGAYNWTQKNPGERTKALKDVATAEKNLREHHSADHLKALSLAKNKQHDYMWNVTAACAFLVGNALFGLSGSKHRPNETEDDKRIMNDLVLLSANTLAQMPKQTRDTAIHETADYVSKLNHVTLNKEQLAAAIHEKVDALSKSHWAARVHPPTHTSAQMTL